jgi:hypothetical protein
MGGGHPISTTHFTSKFSAMDGSGIQVLTLPNIPSHTRNGQNYSSLTGVGRNLNFSTDLSNLKPHNFSRLSDPLAAYQTNKKALTKFIKKTIKDNPEPFRGYLEVSNAT